MLELEFSVHVKTGEGEEIRVVGSNVQLGLWNPDYALVLNMKKERWQGSLANIPRSLV